MLLTVTARSLHRVAFVRLRSSPTIRTISQTALLRAKDSKMPTGPPKHEMQYFPNMANALPSQSGEFRRVLWTGLYSQVVLMTVPVGGDIGDEVRLPGASDLALGHVSDAQRYY